MQPVAERRGVTRRYGAQVAVLTAFTMALSNVAAFDWRRMQES